MSNPWDLAGSMPAALLAEGSPTLVAFAAVCLVIFGFGIGLLARRAIPDAAANPVVGFGVSSGLRFVIAMGGAVVFLVLGPILTETEEGFGRFETRLFLLTLAAVYVVTLLAETIWLIPSLVQPPIRSENPSALPESGTPGPGTPGSETAGAGSPGGASLRPSSPGPTAQGPSSPGPTSGV